VSGWPLALPHRPRNPPWIQSSGHSSILCSAPYLGNRSLQKTDTHRSSTAQISTSSASDRDTDPDSSSRDAAAACPRRQHGRLTTPRQESGNSSIPPALPPFTHSVPPTRTRTAYSDSDSDSDSHFHPHPRTTRLSPPCTAVLHTHACSPSSTHTLPSSSGCGSSYCPRIGSMTGSSRCAIAPTPIWMHTAQRRALHHASRPVAAPCRRSHALASSAAPGRSLASVSSFAAADIRRRTTPAPTLVPRLHLRRHK
jgi:hypothetical protein